MTIDLLRDIRDGTRNAQQAGYQAAVEGAW